MTVLLNGECEIDEDNIITAAVDECDFADLMDAILDEHSTDDILSLMNEEEIHGWVKQRTVEKI